MKTVTLLACMELTGFGVSLKSLQDLSSVIHEEMISLQERAYALSGKKFNFSSSKEISQVCKYIFKVHIYSSNYFNLTIKYLIV